MVSFLSNFIDNFSEGIDKIKYKYRQDDKNCETCRIQYKYWDCFLEYTNFQDNLIEYKCLCLSKIINKTSMKN